MPPGLPAAGDGPTMSLTSAPKRSRDDLPARTDQVTPGLIFSSEITPRLLLSMREPAFAHILLRLSAAPAEAPLGHVKIGQRGLGVPLFLLARALSSGILNCCFVNSDIFLPHPPFFGALCVSLAGHSRESRLGGGLASPEPPLYHGTVGKLWRGPGDRRGGPTGGLLACAVGGGRGRGRPHGDGELLGPGEVVERR